MTTSTAVLLARPSATADRGRFGLIAGATAIAGAVLLTAAHIARMPLATHSSDLSNYVTESGLRPGVVLATLLLTVPVAALIVQALRVGSVARDRRMASLRLAGATPRDVRTIAGFEAGGAALAGGVLAGPAYLLLWLLVGVLAPSGARMLDSPDALDALSWALLAGMCSVAGALAGAAVHGRVVVEPLGVRRRTRAPAPGRASLVVLVAGFALAALALTGFSLVSGSDAAEMAMLVTLLVGLLMAAFAGGPRFVLGCARVLARRRGAEALLASRALRADPRSAGRVAGVLVVCGVALGIEALLMAVQFFGDDSSGLDAFYLAGYGMTAAVVLAAAVVALLTLIVGAADALLDARRPLATLAALGVEESMLVRVLARQLTAAAAPALVLGLLAGGPAIALVAGIGADGSASGWAGRTLLVGSAAALVAGLLLMAVARLAARLLRPMIRAAIDPENLRVA